MAHMYYLDGPILDAHWDLLDKYARRIQYVLYVPQDADIDPSVFFTLALRGKKPLFPSLRQFFTMMYTEELLLFASPSLLRVHMMPLNNDDPFYPASWSFIDRLAEVSPNLRHLYAQVPITGNALYSILKMKNLRHLGFCQAGRTETPLDSTFFSKLAYLQHLSSVQLLGLVDSPRTRNSQIQRTLVDFPSLTELDISGTLPRVVPLLRIGKFRTLESFKLVFTSSPRDELPSADSEQAHWRIFFRILRRNAGSSLKELDLAYEGVISVSGELVAPDYPGALASTFQDLLALNLTKANFGYCLFHSLSTSDIQTFADAWPDLEDLHVNSRTASETNFTALMEIAERMPHLRRLGISLHISGQFPDVGDLPLRSHPLRFLNVGASFLESLNVEAFLLCLLKLFPNLKHVEYGRAGPSVSTWRTVNRRIREGSSKRHETSCK
ncbi:hypothetical protein BDZ97DRAFT_1155211 [Flammula alnicola]|nr:hypothetical protein BDZ97DRAFT_1155211 [Flammula alnicola]